ncbi:hypothetical protein D045_1637 [Vibrio parahaemolyticus VP-NY4]|nr:hypothetical protein D045_1637 [Vibrio parahaemolyticus VP-NY4]
MEKNGKSGSIPVLIEAIEQVAVPIRAVRGCYGARDKAMWGSFGLRIRNAARRTA